MRRYRIAIRIMEVGTDKDHVHFLIQLKPKYSPTKIITTVKSIIAKRMLAEHPEVKKELGEEASGATDTSSQV